MANFTSKDLSKLAQRMIDKSSLANRAAALSLNKAATESIKLAIESITDRVNLQPAYLKRHIRTVARASSSNLRAVVNANERGTLLNRYPNVRTVEGYKVRINANEGFKEIKGARLIKSLRGSGISAIGLRNKDFVRVMRDNFGTRTPAKSRKLQRVIAKARNNPYGMTPLHSRSVNQLFTTAREDISQELSSFIANTFISDFRRLSANANN